MAYSNQKVVLQLKWEHEFQFAGYYAALWQGYYQQAGFDVEIRPATRPDKSFVNPRQELVSGRADFSIGGLDILLGRDQGEPLVVLAPVFQKSPGIVFSLKPIKIDSPAQLSKLKIAVTAGDYIVTEIKALFQAEGIDPKTIDFVEVPPTIETLLSGKADAIVTYEASGREEAKKLGVDVNVLDPADYGIVFYGDTLYTHQRVIDENPLIVEQFLKASLDGWRYALEHRAEIAARISHELPRHVVIFDDMESYNLAFADVIDDYLLFPSSSIGNNNPYRWEKMHQMLTRLGVLEKK